MAERLMSRKEVREELTWNVKDIYETEEEMWAALQSLKEMAEEIEKTYKGKLLDAQTVAACLTQYQKANEIYVMISNYCELVVSVDFSDSHNQELAGKAGRELTQFSAKLSFVDSEIGLLAPEVLEKAASLEKSIAGYLKRMIAFKPYQLSPETEKALAALGQSLTLPYEVYNIAKLADMDFPAFCVGGKEYPLGYALFEDNYQYEPDTQVRREAFAAFSRKLKEYENVTACAYNGQVQTEKTTSRLRGFDNVFDSLLHSQQVDRGMYDRQIDIIMEKLAPHMRKYAQILKKVHGLEKMTYADLKLPLDPGYAPEVTIEEARKYIEEGLSVMGREYVEMIGEAFEKRWIDFAQNAGKSTGGFCASPYGCHSYILLNWNGKMSDVFTLAHELGHAGHFKACNEAQALFDTEVSTYFVEAPSTMNEILLCNYLLKTRQDKRFRRWVLANMIGNTYYHNFVTHLLEAAYQREVYRIVDEGGNLQAETLSGIMNSVLEAFWGDEVELTEGADLTWMRQPHYYMGLYSYTYSAGLTVATQVAKRISAEGDKAVEDWKKVLEAGSTKTPVELAALAGVDISDSRALEDTIDTIGEMIDEIILLTQEMEAEK